MSDKSLSWAYWIRLCFLYNIGRKGTNFILPYKTELYNNNNNNNNDNNNNKIYVPLKITRLERTDAIFLLKYFLSTSFKTHW